MSFASSNFGKLIFVVPVCFSLLVGCGDELDDFLQEPSMEPVKAAIKTALPLAHAASVAMTAMSGTAREGVSVSNSCSVYPCASVVTMRLDENVLPVALASYGTVVVGGLWMSDTTAMLTVTFIDMRAGSSKFSVESVSAFPAMRTETGVRIVYPNVNIDIETGAVQPTELTDVEVQTGLERLNAEHPSDPVVSLDMDAWIVDVNNGGTDDDFSDDTYNISGGGQYIDVGSGSGSVLQMGIALTKMTPECKANPIDGLAVLNEVGASSESPVIGQVILGFEHECNGKTVVTLATGNYVASTGESIPLHLEEP
jgi:hypothetical protein